MRAGRRRHTCSGEGWRGCGVEKMVRRYHHCTVNSCRGSVGVRVKDNAKWWKSWRHTCCGRGRRVGRYLQIVTAVMARSKCRTWRKCLHTPQDSERVTTVQINATSLKENQLFLLTLNCYPSWTLSTSLSRRDFSSGDIAGMNWFIYNNRWMRRRFYHAGMVFTVSPKNPEN